MAKCKRSKKGEKRGLYRGNAKCKLTLIVSLQNGATVAGSCEASKISRDTFYRWCKDDLKFGKKVDEAQESRIQHVEDALYKNAITGSLTAQIFFLCNRAPEKWKNVQKVEANLHGQGPINFVLYDPTKHGNTSEPGNPA